MEVRDRDLAVEIHPKAPAPCGEETALLMPNAPEVERSNFMICFYKVLFRFKMW